MGCGSGSASRDFAGAGAQDEDARRLCGYLLPCPALAIYVESHQAAHLLLCCRFQPVSAPPSSLRGWDSAEYLYWSGAPQCRACEGLGCGVRCGTVYQLADSAHMSGTCSASIASPACALPVRITSGPQCILVCGVSQSLKRVCQQSCVCLAATSMYCSRLKCQVCCWYCWYSDIPARIGGGGSGGCKRARLSHVVVHAGTFYNCVPAATLSRYMVRKVDCEVQGISVFMLKMQDTLHLGHCV